ncbi:MAG: NADH-quinone oxidoreductase subunit J [Deltaproteobacteria bacterium]|nr:NADH-quinone oxidoreductase subunit J [Deltaproteobacteria bacterium]
MSAASALFSICGIACVAGALATVAAKNPVRSAMGLLATIGGIAGLFLLLAAEFLAAIQLIVYAGAIVVLFVFVIMLLGADAAPVREVQGKVAKGLAGGVLAASAGGAVLSLLPTSGKGHALSAALPTHGTVDAIGRSIFTDAIVPFELATALLIVAVVGAIAIARTRPVGPRRLAPAARPTDLFGGPVNPRDDAGRPKENG